MDMRKTKIAGKIYDVCTFEDYLANPSAYTPSMTAIQLDEKIYPLRSRFDTKPGIYVGKDISLINYPTENKEEYLASNIMADFNNLTDIRDAMKKQQMVKDMENEILTNPDNITRPIINPEDGPGLVALKTAINKKNIDLDKYGPRFGPNFNNDKRVIMKAARDKEGNNKKNDLTFKKLISIMNNLDIRGTLTLEDASPDVPNPIGEKIIVPLNLKGTDDDE